jgi:sugar (pentulose or hexulose) kinase
MAEILLLDLGASRVKAVLYDLTSSAVIDSSECISPSVKSSSGIENRFEVTIEMYWQAVLMTVGELIRSYPKRNINELWICSEMHGFVLAQSNGVAITPYISWKDERALFDGPSGQSTYELLKDQLIDFRSITGMNLKSGLPILTLISGARKGTIDGLKIVEKKDAIRVLSLVDWLLFRGGETAPKSNITMSAGLGLYDTLRKVPSEKILANEHLRDFNFLFLENQSDFLKPLGEILVGDCKLKVFGGIGDFQSAIHGSGFLLEQNGIINLGTGSQVAVKITEGLNDVDEEFRIMADGSYAKVITHIPSGRALNIFASFFNEISLEGGGKELFWKIWSTLSAEDIIKSRLTSNLALFESAWGRNLATDLNGSMGIDEGACSVRNVLSGIAKSWLLQYSKALDILDPSIVAKNIMITGGVGKKSKFVIPVLEHLMPGRHFILTSTQTGEETLDGLLQLAKTCHAQFNY